MSGIAGIFHPGTPKPVEPNRIQAMIAAQAHRGPDGDGIWTAAGVGLGHRRLAVIDLEGSPQPMSDGTLTITYDGEVYNFVELRNDLAATGAIFRTAGDTEVLLHAWRAWGPSMLDRLDGMFAFAIHDSAARTLFLARDRLGVKPLHYVELADGSLAFASELKGLLAHPQLRRVPDLRAVEDYLAFGYVPDDSCMFAGVKKLAAGHFLFVERGRPVPPPRQWWDVDFSNRAGGSVKALGEELVDRMREGVRSRMTADVPVGALLSGGVDSSAIVALMAEASPKAVRTCTIGFDDTDDDDRVQATTVARRFATDHRERIGSSGDFGLIDTLVASFDEPFGDPAAFAAYQGSVLARERVTVALAGDGADEALAGYRRYRAQAVQERVRGLLPDHLREDVFGTLGRWYPVADWAPRPLRAKPTLLALARGGGEAYARSIELTSPELRAQLFDTSARAAFRGYRAEDRFVATMGDAPARDAVDRAQYADLKHSLPGAILAMRDRTSMAVGLEVREPLLDHRLVEFCATLPAGMRLRHGEGKWLMRRAMAPYLPRDILHRPQASVQPPVGAWFREALAGEANALAKSRMLGETGWFDMATIARIADEHRMGRREHGRTLWQLVMLDHAMKRMFG